MSTLERAIAIAAQAHEGQKDKAGTPYVLHPLRMMLSLKTTDERITAVLHDVVEDCEKWSFERLQEEGFSEEIIEALKSVTKREGEPYEDFVRRAATNAIGIRVKLADLTDNCDVSRIANPTARDHERIAKIHFYKTSTGAGAIGVGIRGALARQWEGLKERILGSARISGVIGH